jgi:hypothetical protein
LKQRKREGREGSEKRRRRQSVEEKLSTKRRGSLTASIEQAEGQSRQHEPLSSFSLSTPLSASILSFTLLKTMEQKLKFEFSRPRGPCISSPPHVRTPTPTPLINNDDEANA